eukprot:1364967-Pyramimonas_sp.AAC.1
MAMGYYGCGYGLPQDPRTRPLCAAGRGGGFPRTRWLRSHSTLNSVGLLASCHSLLTQVAAVWTILVSGKPAPPMLDTGALETDFDLSVDDVLSAGAEPKKSDFMKDGALDWAAYNKANRGCARRFSVQAPGPWSMVTRLCVQPMVTLTDRLLKRSGMGTDVRARQEGVTTGFLSGRLLEAHHGEVTLPFFSDVRGMLFDSDIWLVLPEPSQTHRFHALAWAMLIRAAAGIRHLMHRPQC